MKVLLLLTIVAGAVQQTVQQLPACTDNRHLGAVALSRTQYTMSGKLEICERVDGYLQWGTVCADSWDNTDAKVVCRQLGFSDNGASSISVMNTLETIAIYSIDCSGDEEKLLDCSKGSSQFCFTQRDAFVTCQPAQCDDGEVRLMNGEYSTSGRVEICINNQWGTIQDTDWSVEDAIVVCRQLQYPVPDLDATFTSVTITRSSGTSTTSTLGSGSVYVTAITGVSQYGSGTGPIHLNRVNCDSTEASLTQCSHQQQTAVFDHRFDAGIQCSESSIWPNTTTESDTDSTTDEVINEMTTQKTRPSMIPTGELVSNSTPSMINSDELTGAVLGLGVLSGVLTLLLLIAISVCIILIVRLQRRGSTHCNHCSSPTSLSPLQLNQSSAGELENPLYNISHDTPFKHNADIEPSPDPQPQEYEIPLQSTPNSTEMYESVSSTPMRETDTDLYETFIRGEVQPYEIPCSSVKDNILL